VNCGPTRRFTRIFCFWAEPRCKRQAVAQAVDERPLEAGAPPSQGPSSVALERVGQGWCFNVTRTVLELVR